MNFENIESEKCYLITGAAGFIGFYLAKKLLESGCKVVGIDNLNNYYDVNLKYDRLEILKSFTNFAFQKNDISNKEVVFELFEKFQPDIVVNLAAQAGVRYSIENPDAYIQSNVIGFYNILEACRYNSIEHLIYASSSSVYGESKKEQFEESDFVDRPVSLYAATKKSNELMAHTYSHLYQIPATGLRFFTVYGPLGRPDMAYFGFLNAYFNNESIKIFNNGDLKNDLYRDFTYIDDIIESIKRLLNKPQIGKEKHKVFNIGNSKPEKLMNFINTLENSLENTLSKKVIFKKVYEPMKPGDVSKTYASTKLLQKEIDFKPKVSIKEGLQKFSDWYVEYYNKKEV